MRRLLHPFVLVVSAILVVGYVYTATRLTSTAPVRAALAAPFLMVWILPVVYWFGDRDHRGRVHEWVQALSFLCMGWLSFLLVLTVGRDVLLLATAALPPLATVHALLDEAGAAWVPVTALAAVCVGALAALRGPTSVASIFPWRGWRRISTDSGSCRSAICTPVRRCGSHTSSGSST